MEFTTEIVFDKDCYFTGEVMRGQVIVINQTSSPQQVSERVLVSLDGFTKTNLIGKQVNNKQSLMVLTDHRSGVGEEIHLLEKIYLTPEDCTSMQLAVGQNKFSFQFELPANLPSSFSSNKGSTIYEAQVSFAIWYFYEVKHSKKVNFRVIATEDLNLNSSAALNSYFSFEKLFPMSSSMQSRQFGVVNTSVRIASQGYVPGETINLAIQISQHSAIAIMKVFVNLIRETSFSCPAGSITETYVLHSRIASRPTGSERGCFEASLEVPQHALPSSTRATSLILLNYCVAVNIQVLLVLSATQVGKFPIIIGTIPLQRQMDRSVNNYTQNHLQPAVYNQQNLLRIQGTTINHTLTRSARSLTEHDFDDNPPSYLEALTMSAPVSPTASQFDL